MKYRMLGAAVVFALALALLGVCACTTQNLDVKQADGSVTFTAKNEVTTMSVSRVEASEGQTLEINCEVEKGTFTLAVSNENTGNTIYRNRFAESSLVNVNVFDDGSYITTLETDGAIGTLEVKALD